MSAAGMTARMCVLAGCERRAHTDLPWCITDFHDVRADLRTDYLRALGRRERLVDGAMVELATARAAIDAWFAEHPREAEPAEGGEPR